MECRGDRGACIAQPQQLAGASMHGSKEGHDERRSRDDRRGIMNKKPTKALFFGDVIYVGWPREGIVFRRIRNCTMKQDQPGNES